MNAVFEYFYTVLLILLLNINLTPCDDVFQEVFVHILDLSETKKVWEFAEGFKRKYKTLNVLVRDMKYILLYLEEYIVM